MVPDVNVQLQVVQKALRDVVAPAIDPTERLAVEQLQISIATLTMIIDRQPHVRQLARKELSIAIDMAKDVGNLLSPNPLADHVTMANELLKDADCENNAITEARNQLLSEISALAEQTEDRKLRKRISRAIISSSKSQTDLFRSWCITSGFELDPSSIPALSDSLKVADAP